MTAPLEHARKGHVDVLRNAVTMTDVASTVRTSVPEPGEHTNDVLAELGLRTQDIDGLRKRGVV
jgi:crotonobetainyl-CoA:carnitine CoA-transferase CaiB-like acyl-CoA transferase